MSNFTFDVFVSYSHADADWVKTWLLPRLEAAGLRACVDYRDFEVGAPSLENMEAAVERSRKTLAVLTPAWVRSEWTKFEALLSQAEDPAGVRRRTLPLMLEPCQIPRRLAIFTYADFTDPAGREEELRRVVAAVRGQPADGPGARLAPHLAHTYALQANFTGRAGERRDLTAWLADEERPVCALVAMGGMGKSALAWYWLKNDVLPAAQDAAAPAVGGAMWWSFYEGESSFARFIDEALRYVGGGPIDAGRFPTTYDRAQEVRRILQARRVLFVLDGFERQLRAYAGLDAAYRADDAADPSRDARSCVDPTAARLLRDIAAGATRAKLLLTTRLMPGDLEDRAGDPLAGVLKRELRELPRDDAVAFMRAQGVTKGTPAEIAAACAVYGYHPLSLRLLSGLIARDARTPGDIAAAPRHDVHADLVQHRHHVLEQSYNALPKRERTLLSRIAAFRGPVDYNALSIFNTFGNEAKFEAALEDLRVRGLLQRDTSNNHYDLHPIVRHYAYDRLTNKRSAHINLRGYFENVSTPDDSSVQSIEDLAPVIELYHHTVSAGLYGEANALLGSRLVPQPLFYRFGAYQLIIELERALFPDGEDRPPRVKDEGAQAGILHALAISYSFCGQPRRAVPLYKRQHSIREGQGKMKNLAIGLGAVGKTAYLPLGELMAAEQNHRRRIELCQEVGDEVEEAVGHQDLGQLLIYRGAFDEATRELDISTRCWERTGLEMGICYDESYRAQGALLKGDAQAALEKGRRAYEIALKSPNESSRIHTEWTLGIALVVEGKHLNAAATHLTEALTRCRRINLVELEPDILLGWARWHWVKGDAVEAHAYAEEALAIADRCEYRLKQAEIHNFLARVALDEGEREVARGHAERARERAWCDGPPYCYRVALDEAEATLSELGAGEGE